MGKSKLSDDFNRVANHQTKAVSGNSDITYCVGLWLVPGNRKRSREHYLTHLPKTLNLLKNKKVIFLYDDESILEFVRARIDTQYFFARKLPVSDMKAHQYIDKLIECAKKFKIIGFGRLKAEKGLIHYRRDLMGSGEEAYKFILTVWLSKVFIIQDVAIKENPFNTTAFAWVDASISRMGSNRKSVNFIEISATDKIQMRGSGMRYKGKRINFNASFILAKIENWRVLNKLYAEELALSIDEIYPNDEETLLHKISMKHGQIFRTIGPTNTSKISLVSFIRVKFWDTYYSLIYFLTTSISNVRK